MTTSKGKLYSVTDALKLAKGALEGVRITIEGEVSEFNDKPGYKAAYFTIADKSAALPCMMWRDQYLATGVKLRPGIKVALTGYFTAYVAKGRMNFTVSKLSLAGEGDLRQKVATLARKLEAEGLMDPTRKVSVPAFCTRVAVVTSPRGKAIHDIIRTLRRRNPLVELLVCGVAVEGAGAADAMIGGLREAYRARPDAILLVRGGGSYEDLMPFNDERLARAVASCPIPVITGIGHEPDTCICDMVGDRRASTPTAAAESVAPDIRTLRAQVDAEGVRIGSALSSNVRFNKGKIDIISSSLLFRDPKALTGDAFTALEMTNDRLKRAIPEAVQKDKQHLGENSRSLLRLGGSLTDCFNVVTEMDLGEIGKGMSEKFNRELALSAAQLNSLSPLSVLARGYSVAYDTRGRVVSSVEHLTKGDTITVAVSDGSIDAVISSVNQ